MCSIVSIYQKKRKEKLGILFLRAMNVRAHMYITLLQHNIIEAHRMYDNTLEAREGLCECIGRYAEIRAMMNTDSASSQRESLA